MRQEGVEIELRRRHVRRDGRRLRECGRGGQGKGDADQRQGTRDDTDRRQEKSPEPKAHFPGRSVVFASVARFLRDFPRPLSSLRIP